MSGLLFNPERDWEAEPPLPLLDRGEVERRLGVSGVALELLGGGLRNLNVRVGSERVLRIYRGGGVQAATATAAKEAALLARGWRSFRVPSLVAAGDDFLVLEHVAHGPLPAAAEHGAAVGCALAEIHAVRFASAGFLAADLSVPHPMVDPLASLYDYAFALAPRLEAAYGGELMARLLALLDDKEADLRALTGSPVLLHADFKVNNLHWTRDQRLLVLDWEFAWSGPPLLDVGQLLRWDPPPEFTRAFARSYRQHGGQLPDGWERWAALFDLFNLVGSVERSLPAPRRREDTRRRLVATIQWLR